VEVTWARAGLVVAVEDDGIGGADLATGTGLRGLRDRVETMGGACSWGPPPRPWDACVRGPARAGWRMTASLGFDASGGDSVRTGSRWWFGKPVGIDRTLVSRVIPAVLVV